MRRLSSSIIGTDDPEDIAHLINQLASSLLQFHNPVCFRFEISVGAVFFFQNDDGRQALIKILSPDVSFSDTQARAAFQGYLRRRGFPCPGLPAQPVQAEGLAVVAEDYLDSGRAADGHDKHDREIMARGLVQLIELGKAYADIDHFPTDTLLYKDGQLWPKPHNVLFDFSHNTEGASWIDEIAEQHKLPDNSFISPKVIGHMDWSAKHCRVEGNQLAAVYDWDSTALVPETRVVGNAMVNFTYVENTGAKITPNLDEMAAFLSAHEIARGQQFSEQEIHEIISTAYYGLAYTARCEHSIDDGTGNSASQARELLKVLETMDLKVTFLNR